MTTAHATEEHRIVVDPKILVGKPVVRGTRIPVELVLQHLADELDLDALYEAFPRLTPSDVSACLKYASQIIAGEEVYVDREQATVSSHATP